MTIARFFERILSTPTHDVVPARDSSMLVRETFYPTSTSTLELLAALRESRTTGRLIFDLRDGGVATIRVREEVNFDIT